MLLLTIASAMLPRGRQGRISMNKGIEARHDHLVARYRSLALLCRQQTVFRPEASWRWLSEAEWYEYLAAQNADPASRPSMARQATWTCASNALLRGDAPIRTGSVQAGNQYSSQTLSELPTVRRAGVAKDHEKPSTRTDRGKPAPRADSRGEAVSARSYVGRARR